MSTMLPLVALSLIKSPSVTILKLAALIVVLLLLTNVFAVISRLLNRQDTSVVLSRISVLLLLEFSTYIKALVVHKSNSSNLLLKQPRNQNQDIEGAGR